MKVRCVRLLNSDGHEESDSSWISIGDIYNVITVSITENGVRSYGIVCKTIDGNWANMALIRAECFDVISVIVPSNWSIKIYPNSSITFGPRAWLEDSFYERFYDRDPDVYPIFERERDIIMKEDPLDITS